MGYSDDPKMVRVDFFKESGKWYDTVALRWDRYSSKDDQGKVIELIHDTFRRCLREQFPNIYLGMRAVCLKPYHEHSHPITVIKRMED